MHFFYTDALLQKEHLQYVHGPFLQFDDAAGGCCEIKGQISITVKEHNQFVEDDVSVWPVVAHNCCCHPG